MKIIKGFLIIAAIACLMFVLGCEKENKAETEALKGAADAAKGAVEAGKIDTTTGEEQGEEGVIEEVPPGGEKTDDDGDGLVLPDVSGPGAAEPVEGALTLQDLVYPITNPTNGNRIKENIGDATSHTTTTSDPFINVWMYYSQILKGREMDAGNNLGDQGKAPLHAFFKISDGGNRFSVNIGEESPGGMVLISIAKG